MDDGSNDENWNNDILLNKKRQVNLNLNGFHASFSDSSLINDNKNNMRIKEPKSFRQKNSNFGNLLVNNEKNWKIEIWSFLNYLKLENDINLSWASNDSMSDDGNEHSLYESSLDLNQDIEWNWWFNINFKF